MKTILLTGGTGAFGGYLLRDLAAREDVRLILIVRAETDVDARARLEGKFPLPEHTEVFAGDLLQPYLGLSEEKYIELVTRVTHILHSAASTRFNAPIEEARRNNVETTANMIDFGKHCKQLLRFGYLSTALVAGKRMGVIKEDEFRHDAGFNNAYQQSKYEAEALVRASGLPIAVFRPPFVYAADEAENAGNLTNFLSVLIKLVVSGRIPFVPGIEESAMDIVNAPETARIVTELFLKDHLSHTTYHITNGTKNLTVKQFHAMMQEEKGAPIPIEYLGNGDLGIARVREKASVDPRLKATYERTESFLSDPGYPKIFDNQNTLSELGISKLADDPGDILHAAVRNAIWNSSK